MEIEKLIDGFENLCYRIMIEMILLPKTLWLLCKRSKNCYDLVVAATKKDTGEQEFQHQTSPIKIVIFYTAFSLLIINLFKDEPEIKSGYFYELMKMDITHQLVILFLFSSFIPLVTSLIIGKVNKSSIPGPEFKLSLNAVFYTRVYYYIANAMFYLLTLSVFKYDAIKKELNISEALLDQVMEWFEYAYQLVLVWMIYKNLRSYYYILRSMIPSRRTVLWVFTILGVGEGLITLLLMLSIFYGE